MQGPVSQYVHAVLSAHQARRNAVDADVFRCIRGCCAEHESGHTTLCVTRCVYAVGMCVCVCMQGTLAAAIASWLGIPCRATADVQNAMLPPPLFIIALTVGLSTLKQLIRFRRTTCSNCVRQETLHFVHGKRHNIAVRELGPDSPSAHLSHRGCVCRLEQHTTNAVSDAVNVAKR